VPILSGRIATLQTRLRECGRIRIGQKGDRGQPQRLTTFRFTSFDKSAIVRASELYGGTVKECTDKDLKGQWEVVTNASEIAMYPAPVDPTQFMEVWKGGGIQRRCDGCQLVQDCPDGKEGTPCLCDPDQPECKPTTRLPVILPDMLGLGVWRIESKGWNAAQELLTTYDFLKSLSGQGMPEASLAIEERTGRVDGKTTRFMVPVIRIGMTPRQLLGGREMVAAIDSPSAPEPQSLPQGAPELPERTHVQKDSNQRGAVFAIMHEMKLPPHEGNAKKLYYEVFGKFLKRDLMSLSTVNDDEWQLLATWLRDVASGAKATPKAFKDWLAGTHELQQFDPFAEPAQEKSNA
jgi:hypothetical protein